MCAGAGGPAFSTEEASFVLTCRAMSTKPTIRELQEELHSIKDRCQDIGIQLGLDDNALCEIEETHPNSVPNQFRQILRLWLSRDEASWSKLIDTLRHPVIDERELATSLEAKYCPVAQSQTVPATSSRSASTSENIIVVKDSDEVPSSSFINSSDNDEGNVDLHSYNLKYFVRQPRLDKICRGCKRVPVEPMKSHCCNTTYCAPCSSLNTKCPVHKRTVEYSLDKALKRQIAEITARCVHCKIWKDQARHLNSHLVFCPSQKAGANSAALAQPSQVTPAVDPVVPSLSRPSPVPLIRFALGEKRPIPLDMENNSPVNPPPKMTKLGEHAGTQASTPNEANSPEFDLPTSFSEEMLLAPPKPEHKCSACQKVPKKAMKPRCCGVLYCKQCASTHKTCPVHKQEKFLAHKSLNVEISKLMICCPNHNKGCPWKNPIDQLKGHLINRCTIPCPYRALGCKESVTNATIREHMLQNTVEHLDQVRRGVTEYSELNSRLVSLENQVSAQCTPPPPFHVQCTPPELFQAQCTPPQLFLIRKVSSLLTPASGWTSPSFYSHQVGCKLHLIVWFSLTRSILNLKIVHDEGLFDDVLKWPCKGRITMEIVNQTRDSGHCRKELGFTLDKASGSYSSHIFPLLKKEPNVSFILKDAFYLKVKCVSVESCSPWLSNAA